MGQLVEVLAVAVEKAASDGPLLGASIDAPRAGRRVAARAVEIGGWALGRTASAEEIEVTLDGAVVARAPLGQPRPDIAESFPGEAKAASAGFELVLDASGAPAEAEFEVRARVGAEPVPIGSLRLRRCWREAPAPGEPRLVSVILACQEGGEALARTIAGLREQHYWPTELLISHPASLDPSKFEAWRELGVRWVTSAGPAAALRNEGIRRSNGELLVFLEAGSSLAAGALHRVAEALERHPQAAGLIDGAAEGEVAGAVYRRSAFEELGGFEESAEGSCDRELAGRAAAYDVLFAPGTLIASGA